MREHPILFSGEMIRAILDGRKTMTRRIFKGTTEHRGKYNPAYLERYKGDPGWASICPYGQPGDHLWVRETWGVAPCYNVYTPRDIPLSSCRHVDYKADDPGYWGVHADKWRPSIFMPRWASRITLEVVAVRVERLQDITDDDAFHEGIVRIGRSATRHGLLDGYGVEGTAPENAATTCRYGFAALWDSINAARGHGWDANDWVWAITFRRLD